MRKMHRSFRAAQLSIAQPATFKMKASVQYLTMTGEETNKKPFDFKLLGILTDKISLFGLRQFALPSFCNFNMWLS